MMEFKHGDRVVFDGHPGTVIGECSDDDGYIVVLLDGYEASDALPREKLAPVGPSRNHNEKYPWASSQHPDKPGNSFRAIAGRCLVTLDGEDVTNRCFYYDITKRMACLYLHRDGKPYIEDGFVAHELCKGEIEVFITDSMGSSPCA